MIDQLLYIGFDPFLNRKSIFFLGYDMPRGSVHRGVDSDCYR